MRNICVFCGSNLGSDIIYKETANELGTLLAKKDINLIYGGANVGLMRCTAEATLNNNGNAIGVITHFLADKHLTQKGLTELIKVDTMQQRKAKMAELADGFIALAGGFGTFEELFEVLTAAQLGFHNKPIAIINTNGFYDHLKIQLAKMVEEKMLLKPHANIVLFANSPTEAIKAMVNYKAPTIEKWIDDIRKDNLK